MATIALSPSATVTTAAGASSTNSVAATTPTFTDFSSVTSVQVSTLVQEHINDGSNNDSYGLALRLRTSGGTVLAAADAGGGYQSLSPVAQQPNATSWTQVTTTATFFNYVNGSATEADWEDTQFELSFTYNKAQSSDAGQMRLLASSSATVTYDQAAPSDDLLADDLTTPANSISVPSIAQTHAPLATAIEALSELLTPTVGQVHAIGAGAALESASELSVPTASATIEYAILADNIESASTVSVATIGQISALLSNSIESATETDATPAIAQGHAIGAADNLELAVQNALGVLQTENTLGATSIEAASELSVPDLASVVGQDALLADDLVSLSETGTGDNLVQDHTLTSTSIEAQAEVPVAPWTQIHPFTGDNRSSTSNLSVPTAAEITGQTNLHPVMISALSEITDPTAAGQGHTLAGNPISANSAVQEGQSIAQTHNLPTDLLEALTELSVPAANETGLTFNLGAAEHIETVAEIGFCECVVYNPVGEAGIVNFTSIGDGKGNLQRARVICADLHKQSYLSEADTAAVVKYVDELKPQIGLT